MAAWRSASKSINGSSIGIGGETVKGITTSIMAASNENNGVA